MKTLNLIIVVACAVILPRALGLLDAESSVAAAALWGAVFGAAGGLVSALIMKLIGKEE